MSQRTDIRAAAAAKISGAGVVPTVNVHPGRFNELDGANFPEVYIYAIEEQIEVNTIGVADQAVMGSSNRQQYRQLRLVVDYFGIQTSTTGIDDILDDGSAAVEAAMLADTTLNGECDDLLLTNVEYVVEDAENKQWGVARHIFNCVYYTTE